MEKEKIKVIDWKEKQREIMEERTVALEKGNVEYADKLLNLVVHIEQMKTNPKSLIIENCSILWT